MASIATLPWALSAPSGQLRGDGPSRPIALVVDDEAALRAGIARLLARAPLRWQLIETGATLAEARAHAARLQPDLVVLDVHLGDEDGLSLIAHLQSATRVLVLSSDASASTRRLARQLGACAFVDKHAPAQVLLEAVMGVASQMGVGGLSH